MVIFFTFSILAAKTQYIGLCDYRAFDPNRVLYTDNNGDTYDFDDFNKIFRYIHVRFAVLMLILMVTFGVNIAM